jgi:hypothetical protein
MHLTTEDNKKHVKQICMFLTNFTMNWLSKKVDSFTAGQGIPFLQNVKIHYHIYKDPTLKYTILT